MITNNAPAKMVIQSIVAGYTKAYIQHSIYTDNDVLGRSFWFKEGNAAEIRKDFTAVNTFSVVADNLKDGTTYSVYGAYYDQIIDLELLTAKISINVSDTATFKTKTAPRITEAYSTSQPVDVGVGAPILNVKSSGEADYVVLQARPTTTGDWVTIYMGPQSQPISIGGIVPGLYRLRLAGFVTLPDGVTVESSGTSEFGSDVSVEYNFKPPSAPTGLVFKAARIQDGKERYDVRVEWQWAKGEGANVREFLLEYVDATTYAASGWTKAQKANVGAARAATLTNFAWNKLYYFRASAIAWGPDMQDITQSATATFILNESTPLDSSFTTQTGIEVNYAYIKGSMKDTNGVMQQTFYIDAATGSVSLGLLDSDGKAPISFDPTSKAVNVDGKVITKAIYAASFVLTNLDGTDNPALYSQGKSYGDNNAGIWMGIDKASGKYKLDIGDSTKYIRWDGTQLRISGDVVIGTPNGNISLEDGIAGKFQVYSYIQSPTKPPNPLSQDYPPPGWSTTPPNRVTGNKIWATTGTLDPVTNKLQTGTNWSDVTQWSGDDGRQGVDGAPGLPGGAGSDGPRGPGFFSYAVNNQTSWSDSLAAQFFQNQFGKGPVNYDVLTIYNTFFPSGHAFTKQWINGAWISPALMVHGNMIVSGTITAEKLVADSAFLTKMGVNVIYNRDAALSSNPEAVYTMKIDLYNGYIHIR
jgi:hypothetical protein